MICGTNCITILPGGGNQYKLALHTHSKLSDGNYTPSDLKKMYMAEGYSAIAFTDHRKCIPHEELTDDRFVALTATELDFSLANESGALISAVHLNAISSNPALERHYDPMSLDYDLINETVRQLKSEDFFVTLNHPVWSNMSTDDLMRIEGVDGVEVYNSIAVFFNNYSDDSAFYEYFLRRGGRAIPIAADDTHKIFEDGSPFVEYYKAFTMIKAPELTYGAIMKALAAGECYASTGPLFEGIWLEGDILHIECSPVYGVFVHSKYLTLKTQDVRKTDTITHTALDISKIREGSPYFWIQIRDTHGGKAWAPPYWFSEKSESR